MEEEQRRKLKRTVFCANAGQIMCIEEINNDYEWLGYRVRTEGKEIVIKISKPQLCCESYGVYCSQKRIGDIIGGEISNVKLYERVGDDNRYFAREKSMIVEINTDKGSFEFIIYCEHNGYYAHEYYIRVGLEEVNGRI